MHDLQPDAAHRPVTVGRQDLGVPSVSRVGREDAVYPSFNGTSDYVRCRRAPAEGLRLVWHVRLSHDWNLERGVLELELCPLP